MATIEIEVVQMLVFRESDSKNNPQGLYVNDYIQFVDTARNYKLLVSASNYFNVGQVVDVRKSVNHLTVGDFFQLFSSGHKSAGQQDVVQWINFGSLAEVVEYEVVTHQLSITQSVYYDFCTAAFQTLAMTDVASVTLVRGRELVHTLVVYSGGVCVITDDHTYSIVLPALAGPNAPTC